MLGWVVLDKTPRSLPGPRGYNSVNYHLMEKGEFMAWRMYALYRVPSSYPWNSMGNLYTWGILTVLLHRTYLWPGVPGEGT